MQSYEILNFQSHSENFEFETNGLLKLEHYLYYIQIMQGIFSPSK